MIKGIGHPCYNKVMLNDKVQFSIVIPTYNPDFKIFETLKKVQKGLLHFQDISKIFFEILIINDGGKKIENEILKIIPNLKIIDLKKNRGVGYAREVGARLAKYPKIFFIDSDVIIDDNVFYVLYNDFVNMNDAGSLGALQSYRNLNLSYSSKLVCAKSCYGFENKSEIIEFSAIHSECCIVDKFFLRKIGGWNFYSKSGGEEFELGHRILANGKKNYLTKKTRYSTYYENILSRCNKIIYRTSNYLPIFFKRKKFESKGAFATNNQVLSVFLTTVFLFSLITSFFFKVHSLFFLFLILLNIFIELDFLKFSKKLNTSKYIPYSLVGIYLINFSILIGFAYGMFNFFIKKK